FGFRRVSLRFRDFGLCRFGLRRLRLLYFRLGNGGGGLRRFLRLRDRRFRQSSGGDDGGRLFVGQFRIGVEIARQYVLVDARDGFEIGKRDAFVHLVHGGVDRAKLDDRAEILDETRIRSAAAGREFRLLAGFVLHRRRYEIEEGA